MTGRDHQHTHGEECHHDHDHDHDACCGHDHGEPKPFDAAALISARGLCLSRGSRKILDHVDADIRAKEIVTLIGPNGSGKTTLVRLLLGLLTPDGGEIRKSAGLSIGYVPQRFDLDPAIPMTVERFLSLGKSPKTGDIDKVLQEVGAERVAGRQLAALSGGELQRVLLARALLGSPKLLVLDEPVRGVDYTGEAELYALLMRLRDTRDLGILLVSHDLHIVMAASDRVLCLNHHLCCSGVPEAVAQHPEYVRLFGAETARMLAVYRHSHDHTHDLTGQPLAGSSAGAAPPGAAP